MRAIVVRQLAAEGPHGSIPVRVYAPAGDAVHPGLVWNHGGAFAGGDLDMPEADWVSRSLAERGFVVVSVDYRLAVEGVHFPVPSDDVVAAFRWVAAHTAELGIDPARLAIGGASAGGDLAAGALLRLRDAGGPLPARALLAYPTVHPELPSFSAELEAAVALHGPDDPRFEPDAVREMNLNFAGDEATMSDPYAFPGLADPTGLPPVFVLNSEVDTLRASGEAFAASLARHGVTVLSLFEPGSRHGHLNRPDEAAARRSIDRITAWLSTPALP
ncbi:alpha/beta hydrolase [Leifsonia sp. ZF2019]|uniref:alpha/beta hydrolase n=1 Tax=Leifsonia sp. ZF2019 TaxID=2781978 RepID=UPI001CBBB35F|nr:alpha/beta hydrolase [Leifsonia sp. ZF2019]